VCQNNGEGDVTGRASQGLTRSLEFGVFFFFMDAIHKVFFTYGRLGEGEPGGPRKVVQSTRTGFVLFFCPA
jgi:hypothetical protein